MLGGKRRPRRVFKNKKTGRFYIIVNKKRKYLKPLTKDGRVLRKLAEVQRELKHLKASIKPAKQYDEATRPNIIKHRPNNYESIMEVSANYGNPSSYLQNEDITVIRKRPGRPPGVKNRRTLLEQAKDTKDLNDVKRLINEIDKMETEDTQYEEQQLKEDEKLARQLEDDEETKGELYEETKGELDAIPARSIIPAEVLPAIVINSNSDLIPKSSIGEQNNEQKEGKKARRRRTKAQIEADKQAKMAVAEEAKQKAIQGMGKKMFPALWDDQINEYFKNQPLFTGTYCLDEIKNIPNQIPQGFIINTSKSTDKSGEHWQSIAISNDAVMFFDSYGDNPDETIIKQLKDKFKEWQLPILMKLKINKIALQAPDTNTCGYFCIKFLDDIFKNKTFAEATEFNTLKNTRNKQGDGKEHNEIQGEATINRQFSLI